MKIRLLILLLTAAMFLAACGGGDATPNTPQDQSAAPTENNNQNNAAASGETSNNQSAPPDESGGEDPPPADPTPEAPAAVSFSNDVLPILQSRCINCHGGDRIEGDLVMRSYAQLMSGSESGPVIIAGDAEASLLYQLASTGEMPKRGANLTPVQLEIIMQWINAGAPDN